MRQLFGLVLLGVATLMILIQLVSLFDRIGIKAAKEADPYRPRPREAPWLFAV